MHLHDFVWSDPKHYCPYRRDFAVRFWSAFLGLYRSRLPGLLANAADGMGYAQPVCFLLGAPSESNRLEPGWIFLRLASNGGKMRIVSKSGRQRFESNALLDSTWAWQSTWHSGFSRGRISDEWNSGIHPSAPLWESRCNYYNGPGSR